MEDAAARESKYQDGQILRFIRVRFPGHAHSYPFILGRRSLSYGQKVMALSDRGMTLGYVNSFSYEVPYSEELEPVRTISRVASEQDELSVGSQEGREKEMEDLCKDFITRHKLDMNLTHVELTGYGKKAVFYFTAPKRVDFRDLLKDLVSEFKIRVELRQISVRERAAALGGLGPCGRSLCCSTFLKQYGNVSIKMAKLQNLSLTPGKLNGLCGQLKCCLSYEEDVYLEKRNRLPREQQLIETANGDRGKVLRLHVFEEQFDMLTERGVIRRYHCQQFDAQKSPLQDWKMPENFEHISHETSQVVGPEVAPPPTPQGEHRQERHQNQRPEREQGRQEKHQEKHQDQRQKRALKTQKNNPFKNRRRKRNKS